jgi:hypothetical protein
MRTYAWGLTATAVIAVGVAAAVGVAGGSSTVRPRSQDTPAPKLGAMPPGLRDYFGVFRRHATARDGVADAAGRYSENGAQNPFGITTGLSRRMPSSGSFSWWVAPSSGGVCLLPLPDDAVAVGASCSSSAAAEAGEAIATTTYAVDDVYLYGLMPDGVGAVTVDYADGTNASVPVSGNGFFLHARKPTKSVRFAGPDGAEHVVPAGSYTG